MNDTCIFGTVCFVVGLLVGVGLESTTNLNQYLEIQERQARETEEQIESLKAMVKALNF